MKKNENSSKYEDRKGFWRIGYLENQDYTQRLMELTRKQFDQQEFDQDIEELLGKNRENYFDENFNSTTEENAYYLFFTTNYNAFYKNKDIVGGFYRAHTGDRWKGVYLEQDLDILKTILANQRRRSALEDYTYIYDYNHISKMCNQEFPGSQSVDEWANYIADLFALRQKENAVYSFPIGSYFLAEHPSEDGRTMYFWMEKNDKPQAKQKGFGINLVDEKYLLDAWSRFQHKYTLGNLVFSSWEALERFVAEVSQNAMPENWERMYSKVETHFGYPVLKSYLEYTLIRLRHLDKQKEGYILRDEDRVYYNTGLLNKFFRQILIGGQLKSITQAVPGLGNHAFEFYYDPYIIISGHDTKFPTERGLLDFPKLASYFEKKEDVLYDASMEIMLNDEHIFEDGLVEGRIPMFKEEYLRVRDNPEEAKNLHIRVQARIQIAIQRARLLAERNHKLAVPQFWRETGEVQFLLPLYMEETEYTGRPECALALRRSKNGGYYEGATILSLDMAYSNARLIAKPDVTWLNRGFTDNGVPDKISIDQPLVEKAIIPFSPVINALVETTPNIPPAKVQEAATNKAPAPKPKEVAPKKVPAAKPKEAAPKKVPAAKPKEATPKKVPAVKPKEVVPKKAVKKEPKPKVVAVVEKVAEKEILPSLDNVGKTGTLVDIVSRPSGKGLKGTILGSSGTIARGLLKHSVPHYTKGSLKVKIVDVNPQGSQYILEPEE